MRLFRRNYYFREIFTLNREIGAFSREIRSLEKSLRKLKKSAAPPVNRPRKKLFKKSLPDSASRRRFASYLGAGSVQTIRQEKFRSDIVRRRRYLMAVLIASVIAAGLLLWKFVL